jgi:hypothetical protein
LCSPCQAPPEALLAAPPDSPLPCVELVVAIMMTGERALAASAASSSARRARCSALAACGRSSTRTSFGPPCARDLLVVPHSSHTFGTLWPPSKAP